MSSHPHTRSIWLSTSLLIKQNDSPLQLPAAQTSPLTRLVPGREIVCYRRRDVAYYYGAPWYRRREHLKAKMKVPLKCGMNSGIPQCYDERGDPSRYFLGHLAQNIPKLPLCSYLFPLYTPAKRLKYLSECTILKVIF